MLLKTCKTWLLLSLCLVNTDIKLWLEFTLICCWEYLIMKYTVWFKNSMKLKFYCIMTAFIVNFLPVAILFTRIKTWSSPPLFWISQCHNVLQCLPRPGHKHFQDLRGNISLVYCCPLAMKVQRLTHENIRYCVSEPRIRNFAREYILLISSF